MRNKTNNQKTKEEADCAESNSKDEDKHRTKKVTLKLKREAGVKQEIGEGKEEGAKVKQ